MVPGEPAATGAADRDDAPAGLPLAQVAGIIAVPGAAGADLLAEYWAEAERRFAVQRDLVSRLRGSLLSGVVLAAADVFSVRQRDIPGQLVLTEKRRVRVTELKNWLPDALSRLASAAAGYGGLGGELLAIFSRAAAPVLWVAGRLIVRGQGRDLLVPAAVVLAAAVVTFAGGRHFGNGWPGSGAHRGFVPAFPAAELAWMAAIPLAVRCAVAGAVAIVRRADLPPECYGCGRIGRTN